MASLVLPQRIVERVQLGLLGGRTAVMQTDYPAATGLKPHGFPAGLSRVVDLITLERWFGFGAVAYSDWRVEDGVSTGPPG